MKRRVTTRGKAAGDARRRKAGKSDSAPPTTSHRLSGHASLREQLDEAKRELGEAREQQTATSEVLKVISSSPGELEPVFNAMLENATHICQAKFGTMFRFDG